MKALKTTAVFLLLLVAADYLFYRLTFATGEQPWVYIADFLVKSILLFLLLINILYQRVFTFKSNIIIVLAWIILPLLLSLVVANRLVAAGKFYYYSKTTKRNFSGRIWQYDDSLSYKGVPLSEGTYNYFLGDTIEGHVPLFFDTLGFRTVPDSLKPDGPATDLFLGCSYTFGDYVDAAGTYPYLTARLLGHRYVNGAILGYGAGQMIQVAETLLPRRPFRYVFIQLSSWTLPRAMELNGPTRFGYRPFPYFYEKDDSILLELPAYKTLMYSAGNWRKTPETYRERMLFGLTDGYRIEVHDYFAWRMAQLKVLLGILPSPAKDKKQLEAWFFHRMTTVCRDHGAEPVFLKLMYPSEECGALVDSLRKEAMVIDLDSALQVVQEQRGLSYKQLFKIHHIMKNDSVVFDGHPNRYAHGIFASTISRALRP